LSSRSERNPGFDYYTGIVFEGSTANWAGEICSGGRYDHMIGRYGKECPSTGFAIDIEAADGAERQGTCARRCMSTF
jgi:ATP phosphoribosyltransferase regulatory subunit